MNEIIIELEDITPKEFFGEQNSNIELLKKYFPKLKIVARGNKIKAFGDEALLEEFDRRITMLLKHFSKYNKLDENAIERVLTSQSSEEYTTSQKSGDVIVHGVGGRLIKAQTANQRKLVESMRKNDMVFAIGPAGTGKTYTGVALAVQALKNKEVRRIILTRPAVEAGENLGFLPGDLKEKLDPYMQPLYDALRDMIAPEKLAYYIENGTIQIAPLAFMRGRTLDNAFVILDERPKYYPSTNENVFNPYGEKRKIFTDWRPWSNRFTTAHDIGVKRGFINFKKCRRRGNHCFRRERCYST